MQEIAKAIQEGAGAYLNKQYKTIGMIAVALFVIIGFVPKLGWTMAFGFMVGAVFSALNFIWLKRGITRMTELAASFGAASQKSRADAAALPGPHQRLPPHAVEGAQHEELHRPTRAVERAEEPCRDDPAFVDDDAVPRPEPAWEIRKVRVLPPASRAVKHEQLRGIAWLGGLLRDPVRRQVVVEEGYVHRV